VKLDALKGLQEMHAEWARDTMREDQHLSPVAFVVSDIDKARQAIKYAHLPTWGDVINSPQSAHADTGVMCMLLHEGWENLYSSLNLAWDYWFERDKPNPLPMLFQMAETHGMDDPYLRTVRPFLKVTGLAPRDVVTDAVRYVARQCDAQAVIVCHETWIKVGQGPKPPGSLADDPASTEQMVCTLDAREYVRMLYTPVQRTSPKKGEARDSGRVLGFGETFAMIDDGTDIKGDWTRGRLEGRMVRFLERTDEAEKRREVEAVMQRRP
jgi:hypothetical protein